MTPLWIRVLTGLGSLILLITAGLHLGGLDDLNLLFETTNSEFLESAIKGVWILLSVQFLFMACLAFGLSFYRSWGCAAVLMAFACWLFVNALIIFANVGFFIAIPMLIIAGLCYGISGLTIRRSMKS